MRGEQQRRRAMMQPPAGVPQMAAAPPMPPQPPPQPEQRSVPRPPPPPGIGPQPRTWDSGPPDPSQYDLPPEPPGPPTPEPPPPSPTAGKPQESAMPPIMAGEPPPPPKPGGSPHPADMPTTSSEAGVRQKPEQTSQTSTVSETGAAEEPVVVHVTNEQVAKFSERLEEAISSGLVTPAMFADGFIKETSPETTLAIVQAIGPDQLVDAVAQQPGAQSTAIVTREGRKFVHELWAEATQKAVEMLQGAAPEQEG
jgi:hypothetical protein